MQNFKNNSFFYILLILIIIIINYLFFNKEYYRKKKSNVIIAPLAYKTGEFLVKFKLGNSQIYASLDSAASYLTVNSNKCTPIENCSTIINGIYNGKVKTKPVKELKYTTQIIKYTVNSDKIFFNEEYNISNKKYPISKLKNIKFLAILEMESPSESIKGENDIYNVMGLANKINSKENFLQNITNNKNLWGIRMTKTNPELILGNTFDLKDKINNDSLYILKRILYNKFSSELKKSKVFYYLVNGTINDETYQIIIDIGSTETTLPYKYKGTKNITINLPCINNKTLKISKSDIKEGVNVNYSDVNYIVLGNTWMFNYEVGFSKNNVKFRLLNKN